MVQRLFKRRNIISEMDFGPYAIHIRKLSFPATVENICFANGFDSICQNNFPDVLKTLNNCSLLDLLWFKT